MGGLRWPFLRTTFGPRVVVNGGERERPSALVVSSRVASDADDLRMMDFGGVMCGEEEVCLCCCRREGTSGRFGGRRKECKRI